jgi:MscS family membrane protein
VQHLSNRLGRVEDITLRSVRLRTLDRTLVSVPAGVLAQAGIENFSTRNEILVQTTLRLRYGTSVEQLKRILGGVRTLLAESSRIEAGTSRIRLVNFGDRAVELELFAYVLTSDVAEFMAVREALLLDIASIVEAAGSAFAQPTFVYMERETGVDAPPARDSGVRDDVRLAQPNAGLKR